MDQSGGERGGRAAEPQSISLCYGEFGWQSLESDSGPVGRLDRLLDRALAHLDSELHSRRGAVRVPRFKPPCHGTPRTVRVNVDRGRLGRLRREARRQGVTLERLLEHAPLLYLADLEAGRAASAGRSSASTRVGSEPA